MKVRNIEIRYRVDPPIVGHCFILDIKKEIKKSLTRKIKSTCVCMENFHVQGIACRDYDGGMAHSKHAVFLRSRSRNFPQF